MTAGALAGYADWPAFLAGAPSFAPSSVDAREVADVLGVRAAPATDVRIEREWTDAAVRGRELTWQVGLEGRGFGPRTRAWLLEPADVAASSGDGAAPSGDGAARPGDGGARPGDGPRAEPAGRPRPVRPGILLLHCHGGVRSTGADQFVDTGEAPSASAVRMRERYYAGRATANDLARAGFTVLAHDTFSWGSRAFDLRHPSGKLAEVAAAHDALRRERGEPDDEVARFDAVAAAHEDVIAKAAGVLGTTFAGAVATDDLAALGVLAAWPGVDPDRLGVAGLSGGGGRALLVAALDGRVRAAAVACMMATADSLVPDHLDTHSWLLHSPGLARVAGLPELAAIGAPRDLLVQYGEHDELFPLAGMRTAHARLRDLLGDRYWGVFHDAGHEWTAAMQAETAEFLVSALVGPSQEELLQARAPGGGAA